MQVNYNIRKEERKAMVGIVGAALGINPAYCGAPTFSYKIGAFEIVKDGSLCFDDATDSAEVDLVCAALREAGFTSQEDEHSCKDMTENAPPPTDAIAATDEDSLSISLPRNLFTETALTNLDALLVSKGRLIRHAFNIEEATYMLTDDRITFKWLHGTTSDETVKAYTDFISKLCTMARTQKRAVAKEKIVDNEKYAFRCFLLRLGMIGDTYKKSRKILLQNLTGSSAFKSGHRKGDEDHTISE